MLVLTRKADQTITIGEDVEITVIRVRGNSVRLGIKAPKEIRVTRAELDSKPPRLKAVETPMIEMASSNRESSSPQVDTPQLAPTQDSARTTRATEKAKRVNRIAAYSADQEAIPRRIIMGRTTRHAQQPSVASGPLSEYLQNS